VTVRANNGRQPTSPSISALKRYWTLTAPQLTADLSFQYPAADIVGDENAYVVARYAGGFTAPLSSVNSATHIGNVPAANPINGDWFLLESDADFDGMPDAFESANGLN